MNSVGKLKQCKAPMTLKPSNEPWEKHLKSRILIEQFLIEHSLSGAFQDQWNQMMKQMQMQMQMNITR